MRRWRADVHNLSTAHNNVELAPNRVWQDYAAVSENHHTSHSERSRGIPRRKLKGGFILRRIAQVAFPRESAHHFLSMDYDVAIIGGAFSGAATALMLKRRCPNARVLIIEKTTEFDRKVGESTTEVSSCYMTRILGLTHHLGHHHLPKQGLRLWFSQRPEQSFDDCVELGARYGARLAGFQVDRATLDTHLLEEAVKAGCELCGRPK